MPMHALPIAPVDFQPAPQSTPQQAQKTGNEGLFAAHLLAASTQQEGTTSQPALGYHKRVSGGKEMAPEPSTDQNDLMAAAEETLVAILNGTAGATLQTVPVQPSANTPTPAVAGAAPGGATAVANMLEALTKGSSSSLQMTMPTTDTVVNDGTAEGSEVASTPEAHLSAPSMVANDANDTQVPNTNPAASAMSTADPVVPTKHAESLAQSQLRFTITDETAGLALKSTDLAQLQTASVQGNSDPADQPVAAQTLTTTPAEAPKGNQTATNPVPIASALSPGTISPGDGTSDALQTAVPLTETTQQVNVAQPPPGQTLPAAEQDQNAVATNAAQPGNPVYVQNKYGQIIAIQHNETSAETEETDSPAAPAVTNAGQRLDANSNYIHSHLPKETPDKGMEQNSGQPAASTPKNQQEATVASEPAQPGQTFGEQTVVQKNQPSAPSDSQPLVFTQPVTSSQTTPSSTPGQSTVYHLASGLMVPEGTVVDQMIAHFAVNRRLETGEVTLRLHPQELGEVRMAIKVEQDNVKAHIIAQNPQAQEMIDRHLPRLREALEQQGLNLHQVEVTVATHDNAAGDERFRDHTAWRQPTAASNRSSAEQPVFSLESDESLFIDPAATTTTLSVLA